MDDDLAQLRRRHAELSDDLDRLIPVATAGTAAFVAKTTTASTAGRMFGIQLQGVTCAETENAAPTFAADPATIYALHLGSTAPAVGTPVLVVQVEGVFFFQA